MCVRCLSYKGKKVNRAWFNRFVDYSERRISEIVCVCICVLKNISECCVNLGPCNANDAVHILMHSKHKSRILEGVQKKYEENVTRNNDRPTNNMTAIKLHVFVLCLGRFFLLFISFHEVEIFRFSFHFLFYWTSLANLRWTPLKYPCNEKSMNWFHPNRSGEKISCFFSL